MIDPGDLICISEAADKLGMKRGHLYRLAESRHTTFPNPIRRLSNAVLYLWSDIVKWDDEQTEKRKLL